ncbi:NUDIX hydrolase [Streptomyces sp. LN245]|uniref:NUDIX hydrolase n=1 Tax=Streptomyces sp. LN245 TaxID=3112975 RepID=UPI003712FDC7
MPADGATVAGAVIVHAGRVLMMRRGVPAGSVLWTFPSGKVEADESPADAAAREALEETGVTVEPGPLLGERVHPVTGWRVVYVACRLVSGEAWAASPREVAEVTWAQLGDLHRLVPDGVFEPVRKYLTDVLPH